MSKVKRLPEDLANKIAAGEVVERPASVVKELVENAIDAGATRIRVEADKGGLARIVVADDGDGMTEEDAILALERHATSKIRAFDDLLHLTSFGFRGEALPSIASVGKLTLISRPRHKDEGVRVTLSRSGKPTASPVGCAPGTSVEVVDLFDNVPARKKFLKSTATESAHVGEAVLAAALARPEITFELLRDGKLARTFARAKNREERARDAAGGEVLHAVSFSRGDTQLEAFLTRPERSRSGAGSLHLIVNGRVVKDRGLARAIAQAYGSLLEPGRYPLGVVYIDIPPEQVDVNVHPQKAEVRFAQGRALLDTVARELAQKLPAALAMPDIPAWSPWAGGKARPVPTTTQKSADLVAARDVALAIAADFAAGRDRAPEDAVVIAEGGRAVALDDAATEEDGAPQTTPDGMPESGLFAANAADFYASLRYLGQAHAMYLVCEGEDGLFIIDQHAAAERVTFDRLRKQWKTRAVPMQHLLVPEILNVGADDAELVEMRGDEIRALGVELFRTGPSSISVVAVPKMLRASPERIARDLLAELKSDAPNAFSGAVDLVYATMACHGSIRAGDSISREEAEALLFSLRDVDFSGHCPHGRPVVVKLSWEELARRVGR